jgi:hypothetical protein
MHITVWRFVVNFFGNLQYKWRRRLELVILIHLSLGLGPIHIGMTTDDIKFCLKTLLDP